MVIIRLSRGGAKKRPFYNIVATDSRSRRDGNFLERLGFYDPLAKIENPFRFRIAGDRLQHWKDHGAQMSPAVERLVKKMVVLEQISPTAKSSTELKAAAQAS